MRTNKTAICVLTPMTIISFTLALLLHLFCNGCEFVINTLQGVFGSSLLTLIMAIIGYFVERRKTLEKFWTYGHKIMRNYGKYHYEMSIEEKMDAIILMNEFDYSSFDDAFGEIEFLFSNKKLHKKIGENIYKKTLEIRKEISVNAFHFLELKKELNEHSRSVANVFVGKLDDIFFIKNIYTFPQEDGTPLTQTEIHNKVTEELDEHFVGWYYDLMYFKHRK